MDALAMEIDALEANPDVGCIVLTGSGRAFVAGADIKEMKSQTVGSMTHKDWIAPLDRVARCRIPIIAAVNGFALGGGCELAMACDIIVASTKAVFGQPEIKIGAIPGAGGTQRLARSIGKTNAMRYILTGESFSAQEALQMGLVSDIYPPEQLTEKAVEMATKIASFSKPLILHAKDCVNRSEEVGLAQGITYERRVFHSIFGLDDQTEGMEAFAEKRSPHWSHT